MASLTYNRIRTGEKSTPLNKKLWLAALIRVYVYLKGTSHEYQLIRLALRDIEKLFRGEWRYSGAPMVIHSLRVGWLLCQAGESPRTVIAGLLHDSIEDTEITHADLRSCYGSWIADIVESVSKTDRYQRTHQKLVTAAKRESSVMVIKVYDRLDNMRELGCLPLEKQDRISLETTRFYVPQARSVGIQARVIYELRYLSNLYQSRVCASRSVPDTAY